MAEGYVTLAARYCLGCRHHHSQMVHSGRDPLYEHFCQHPTHKGSQEGVFQKSAFGFEWRGRDIGNKEGQTPIWCPAGPRKEGP